MKRLSRAQFDEVFRKGATLHGRLFLIKYAKSCSEPAFGVGVSRKKVKKAVDRNLIKRRVRDVLRGIFPSFSEPLSVVVLYVGGLPLPSVHEIKKDLENVLNKGRIRS